MSATSNTEPAGYRSGKWLVAPALAAIYPVLSLYAATIRDANARDAVLCGIFAAAVAILVAFVLRSLYKDAIRASLAAVTLVVWLFAFQVYVRVGRVVVESIWSTPYKDYILYALWVILFLPLMFFVWRVHWNERREKQLYRFALLAGVASIAIAAVQSVYGYLEDVPKVTAPVSIWENDQQAIPASWTPAPMAEHRDIYYVLLDRYGSAKALQRFFGFDNSEFCDALEQRGFVVDRSAVTSYPMTSASMASTLNMRYLHSRVEEPADYFATVAANEVGKLLIKTGYTYYFFGNQYDYLRKSSIAQVNLKISMLPCEFADSLVNMTPLRPFIGREHKHQFVIDKFRELGELATNPALTFAYAHFLVPHPPYAFARDGSSQSEINRATRPEKELYIDQLVATNRLVLQTVDEILGSSPVKPIIILEADEGPYLMAGDESLSRDEKIAKRVGILNAILIPDDSVRARLPKPLTPVNTFRFLFKEYFGAPIDLLPNRVFFWEKPEPTGVAVAGTEIIEVTRDFAEK